MRVKPANPTPCWAGAFLIFPRLSVPWGLEEGQQVPTWTLQPSGSAYLLRRLRPTGAVRLYRYDGTGRLLDQQELEPGTGYLELQPYPGVTLLHLVGDEEEVLKVPAF